MAQSHSLLKINALLAAFVMALSFASAAFAAQDNVLVQAQNLIRSGNAAAAYQLLEPLEKDRAGDVDYDYLFGVAAVESGNASRGAFALERVLALDPNNKDARAEIAKAHYLLGESGTSKEEFINVLLSDPDEATKKSVNKLLDAIDKAEGKVTTYNLYLDVGLGHDTNVSSAPNVSTIAVPVIGGLIIPLDSSAREKSDSFLNGAAGISVRHPFMGRLVAFGSASVAHRQNNSESDFNNTSYDLNGGVTYFGKDNSYTVALQDNYFNLDGERFRHAYGGTLQWSHTLDASNQVGMYAQLTKLDYKQNRIQNAFRQIIGISGAHVFAGELKPIVFASIYGGIEDARSSRADFLDQDVYGMRAGGQLTFSGTLQGFASIGFETRDNDEDDPIFLKSRKDSQYDAVMGLRYVPVRNWTIRPQFSYTKNNSNITINEFDRKIISVNVRKDFNW